MKARYDIHLMVQTAKMYYLEGLTQEMIAKELGISRSSVSIILVEAKDFGIVEINVKEPKSNVVELAEEFIRIYSLRGCLVIPTAIDDIPLITKIAASRGADYAEDILESRSTVGIAWGATCYEFMLSFSNRSIINDLNVVPLIGGSYRVSSEYQLNEMVRMFAEKVQGTPSFIYAPAIAETVQDKELFMQSMSMKGIIGKWSAMDTAIVSAGAPPEYYDDRLVMDTKNMDLMEVDKNKIIGDICARRYNLAGEFIKDDFSLRIMGIDEDSLRRIKNVICIAAGRHKVLSIIGALRTGAIDYLVTDENTARSVLSLLNHHP